MSMGKGMDGHGHRHEVRSGGEPAARSAARWARSVLATWPASAFLLCLSAQPPRRAFLANLVPGECVNVVLSVHDRVNARVIGETKQNHWKAKAS